MALSTAAAITAGVGAATGGFQLFQGMKQTKEAKRALENLETPELTNVYEGTQISTVGSDYLREENSRTTASVVDASRNAGLRGVLAGIPRIQAASNNQNIEGQRYLDDQVIQRERAIADDNRRLQGVEERRYNAEMEGIGQQLATGQQNTFSGIRGAANAGISAAQNAEWGGGSGGGTDAKVNPYSMGTVGIPSYNIGMQDTGSSALEEYNLRKLEEERRNRAIQSGTV